MPDFPKTWCVVAVPQVGVSTPAAFKAWDGLVAEGTSGAEVSYSKGEHDETAETVPLPRQPATRETKREEAGIFRSGQDDALKHRGLTAGDRPDRLEQLSLAYSSLSVKTGDGKPGTSGIVRDSDPETKQGLSGESQSYALNDLAENTLLALVRTGIGNDFEEVVFPQYPSLRITKRQLMGSDSDSPAIYAALSGSGSALFGLYRSEAEAKAAQQRVQSSGVQALLTQTLPRAEYWERMFAE
jgi:4-diphosphocytidyl-2-C-methyl-D-erythritol kinase